MPITASSLLAASGGALTWVLAYFAVICGLAVGAVLSAHETAPEALPATRAARRPNRVIE